MGYIATCMCVRACVCVCVCVCACRCVGVPLCKLHLVAAFGSRSYTCVQDGLDTVQLALDTAQVAILVYSIQ